MRVIAACAAPRTCASAPAALARDIGIEANTVLGILASPDRLPHWWPSNALQQRDDLEAFAEALAATKAGIAEVVIPPGSELIGKSARDIWLRKTYGLAMVALHRGGETLREDDDIRNLPLQAGDALVVHTTWDALAHLEKDRNFVVLTTEYPHEETRPTSWSRR